jgi:hypothetical protein
VTHANSEQERRPTLAEFRDALVRHGVIQSQAISDGDNYDGAHTLSSTRRAYAELFGGLAEEADAHRLRTPDASQMLRCGREWCDGPTSTDAVHKCGLLQGHPGPCLCGRVTARGPCEATTAAPPAASPAATEGKDEP